jgi:hypothetical protein
VSRAKNIIILIFVLVLAAILRLINIDWDRGNFLHPDERFLNMSIQELKLPSSLSEYFDQKNSGLNPRNYGRDFFVYGNLPLSISKLTTNLLKQNSLEEITITGRLLSILADLMVIPIIYLIVLLLEKNLKGEGLKIHPDTKLWASLIYGLSVLPIQQAHFFTTDTFLNFFLISSFYFSLKYFFEKKFFYLIVSGIFWGLALASKISGIFILPLNLSIISLNHFWPIKKQFCQQSYKKNLSQVFLKTFIFFLTSYFALRLSSPYMFEHTSFLQVNLNSDFINNLKELKSYSSSDIWFPPAIQWMNRSVFFGLKNLVIFGFGIVASIFTIKGIGYLIAKIIHLFKRGKLQNKPLSLVLVLIWLGGFLIYYSQQFVQSIRYYLIIYPFLAIFAGLGITTFLKEKRSLLRSTIIVFFLGLWPLMFISVYIQAHPRIQASEWIYQNIPNESLILTEYWDDTLPLHLTDFQKHYETYRLPVFAQDNEQKWLEIDSALTKADYYILSSNRAWASIIRVPEKYPQMSKFYQNLLDGQSNYQLVAEFHSYPSLKYLGIPIDLQDSWADEAFTVYDHPQVLIFKKISD